VVLDLYKNLKNMLSIAHLTFSLQSNSEIRDGIALCGLRFIKTASAPLSLKKCHLRLIFTSHHEQPSFCGVSEGVNSEAGGFIGSRVSGTEEER